MLVADFLNFSIQNCQFKKIIYIQLCLKHKGNSSVLVFKCKQADPIRCYNNGLIKKNWKSKNICSTTLQKATYQRISNLYVHDNTIICAGFLFISLSRMNIMLVQRQFCVCVNFSFIMQLRTKHLHPSSTLCSLELNCCSSAKLTSCCCYRFKTQKTSSMVKVKLLNLRCHLSSKLSWSKLSDIIPKPSPLLFSFQAKYRVRLI